jgi:hypothetical protein
VTAPRAADLPVKTYVRAGADIGDLWKRPEGTAEWPWWGPRVDWVSDASVQILLDDGAQVLRVGDGSGQ